METLYWPQRRLYEAIQKDLRSGGGATDKIYLLGFRVGKNAVCVVDFASDRGSASGDLAIVGVCVDRSRLDGKIAHAASSSEVSVDFELSSSTKADSLDRSLRVCSKSDSSSAIIFYDKRIFVNGPTRSGLGAVGSLSAPLQKLSNHFASEDLLSTSTHTNASMRAFEAIAYYAIGVPFAVANTVWKGTINLILRARVLGWVPVGRGATLKEYSQLAHLLSCRGSMMLGLPDRVRARYRRSQNAGSYSDIFDFLLYLALDYALGSAFASLLTSSLVPMVIDMELSPTIFLDLLRENVVWLMGAPAGFKVNVRLAAILGNGILMWLDFWEFLVRSATTSVVWETLVTSSSAQRIASGVWHHAGLTLQLSAISDMLWLMTWNSYWVFLYFTKLNAMQLRLLSSLWKLFLGKKNNVLRNRVDSCEYDVNQLLLGTLLFTILVFLVTTNAVFFVFFGLVRFGVWLSLVSLWLPIVLLRGLPLVSIFHRLMKPSQYTESLTLETLDDRLAGESLSISDVSPSRRRERDNQDQDAVRGFLLQQQQASTSQKLPLLFRLVARPAGLAHLFHRLSAYQKQVARSYNASAIVNSCLFGAEIVPVDVSVLFETPTEVAEPPIKQKME